MTGELIAVFSCAGKTHLVAERYKKYDCVDHDMAPYAIWGAPKIQKDWLKFYLEKMRFLRNKYSMVFVNATPEILEHVPSTSAIIYPKADLLSEYVERAYRRSDSDFYSTLHDSWDTWIAACDAHKSKFKYRLGPGEYLTDWMDNKDDGGYIDFLCQKYDLYPDEDE